MRDRTRKWAGPIASPVFKERRCPFHGGARTPVEFSNPCHPCPPSPAGIPAAPFGSGLSATIASVVIKNPATEAAACNATRRPWSGDDAGLHHLLVLARLCVKPEIRVVLVGQPADDDRAFVRRNSRRSGTGDWMALRTISMPTFWSLFAGLGRGEPYYRTRNAAAGHDSFLDRGLGRVHGVVDPVLALCLELGAPPTRMMATPPASLARRSCSFSRS